MGVNMVISTIKIPMVTQSLEGDFGLVLRSISQQACPCTGFTDLVFDVLGAVDC